MRMRRIFNLLVLLAFVAAAACTQNMPQTQTATSLPTVAAATVAPPTTLAPQLAADNWDDRTLFRAGLIKAEQKTLDQWPGATVYHLEVQVADDFSSLQGQERVRYTNRAGAPLDALYFQLFPNMSGGKSTVSAVRIDGQEIQPVYESDYSTVRVPLANPLQAGERLVAQMDFKVELPRERGGNYGLLGYFDNILVLDGFYPAIPVYDEQGWHAGQVPPNADETFQDASFYVVRVTAPANLTVMASGLQVDQTQTGDHQTVTLAAGPARDFYLAASDRLAVVSETAGETKVNSYAFKDQTEGAQLALRTAVNALKSYGARLGAYPYTEFDVVSTPMQYAYGIEYPGLTGINYALYDLKATVGGLPAPVMLESTVAHEVGHQWFYNVVGNDQINAPWLDESVDQYLTGLYFLDQYGQQGMAGYRDSWLSRWDRVNRELIPIGMPAGRYQGKEYGAIVYGRGPLFLEALAQKMGQAAFDQFFRDYYQSHRWGIGTTASFKQLAEKQCQCDLTPLFDEWVYQTPSLPTSTPAPALSGAGAGDSTSDSGRILSYSALTQGFDQATPLDYDELAMPDGAPAPAQQFEGRLELLDEATSGHFKNVRGGETLAVEDQHLPEFDFEFVQSGSNLIPVRRGLIVTSHPSWNYILEPGRVWQEPGDQGFSRASFPFTLTPKNGNSSFNGVMTFLFNSQSVSKVWYQVTQETSASLRMDLWGLLDAGYHPGPVAGAEQIRQAFAQELAGRFPTRPIEQLARDYPGIDVTAFSRPATPEHMTTYGVVVNGINYRGKCATRSGNYPYCESIRMASFSTAKSAFVSVALMRLAQKYGPEVATLLIRDYLPEAAGSPGDWSHVTFDDTLDMATGNFNTSNFMVDEEGRIFSDFFGAETYADKIRIAFDWPHRATPGTTWVYRSSDTFIAVAALQNYLRTREGAGSDLFDFVVREVYQPLGLGPGVLSTLRTSDNGWQGQPVGAMGLWWSPDDIAKLGAFLNVSRGAANGQQLLYSGLLAAALQSDPKDRGVDRPGGKYNNAFWADRYTPAEGYGCTFFVPYMAGYSGNIIALLPNNVTYYYFSDNREFDWRAAVRETDKIKPLCPSS